VVLERLGRLTEDEARITAAQTLEVVCGLFENMREVLESEIIHYALSFGIEYFPHQMAKYRPIVSGRRSVRSVGHNEATG